MRSEALRAATVSALLLAALAQPAHAQTPRLTAPRVLALGVEVPLRASGAAPASAVVLERRREGSWRRVATTTADQSGGFGVRVRPRPPRRRMVFRAVVGEVASAPVVVRARPVTLDAVGDVNLGDGPGSFMSRAGVRAPWLRVAPMLRRADVAIANLECAVSRRGTPRPKRFVFRGTPRALRAARRFAGLDVVSLANNHAADYGTGALLDTLRHARDVGLVPIGAGRTERRARRPRILTRLGLRIAFLGFSDVNPLDFPATPSRPGTARATEAGVARAVRHARRRADVVVVYFHWGVERIHTTVPRQRRLGRAAAQAGAAVVLGAHPHVLQPIDRRRRRLVAWSLGNFVWSPPTYSTSLTGVLHLGLSTRGVERARLRRGRIIGSRPRLGN